MKKILLFTVVMFGIINPIYAQEFSIGTIERAPFVMKQNNALTGFSIELADKIGKKLGLDYSYKEYSVFGEMLGDVEKSKLNMAVANISITSEREKVMDFSHPIFDGGITLMKKQLPEHSFLTYILSPKNMYISVLFFVLFLGLVFLLKGKKENRKKMKFIFSFLLFLIYVATINVNYGLEKNKIHQQNGFDIEKINQYKIGAIASSTSQNYLISHNLTHNIFQRLDELYKALGNGTIDVVMHDSPILKYYSNNNLANKTVGGILKKEKYAIVFPENSPYKEKVNLILLELKSNGEYEKLYNKYFGEY